MPVSIDLASISFQLVLFTLPGDLHFDSRPKNIYRKDLKRPRHRSATGLLIRLDLGGSGDLRRNEIPVSYNLPVLGRRDAVMEDRVPAIICQVNEDKVRITEAVKAL